MIRGWRVDGRTSNITLTMLLLLFWLLLFLSVTEVYALLYNKQCRNGREGLIHWKQPYFNFSGCTVLELPPESFVLYYIFLLFIF